MDDREVIEAFVSGSARKAFGPALHIEGDALFLHGWWQAAFRIAPDVFILRNEEPPEGSKVVEQVAGALAARGLEQVGVDLPAMTAIIYAELALGDVSWTLWACDREAGERALATRATTESFFGGPTAEPAAFADFGAELGGARRIAGLPPSLVLTVGLASDVVAQLEASMVECRFVSKSFDEIVPSACRALIPTMIVVDATARAGQDFIAGLQADPFCRLVPLVSLGTQSGADIELDAGEAPAVWVARLRRLLP